MQPHLPGIDLREEVLTQQRKERQRTNHKEAKKRHGDHRVRDAERESIPISFTEAGETSFEDVVNRSEWIESASRGRGGLVGVVRAVPFDRGAHQNAKQQRDECERQQQAGDQRNAYRQ